jgi:RecB family exonuclease
LEDHVGTESGLNPDTLLEDYEVKRSSYDPNSIINDGLIDVGKNILLEFYDRHSEEKFSVKEKEMHFSFVIGSFYVNGFIDRIDEYENRVEIIDYKTGKWEVAQNAIKNNLQLGIYALAAKNEFPDKEIYAELYYLRSGKRKGHVFTDEDLENAKIQIIEYGNKIINDNNFSPTHNERVCSFCDHAKSGACAVGVMRNKKSQGR